MDYHWKWPSTTQLSTNEIHSKHRYPASIIPSCRSIYHMNRYKILWASLSICTKSIHLTQHTFSQWRSFGSGERWSLFGARCCVVSVISKVSRTSLFEFILFIKTRWNPVEIWPAFEWEPWKRELRAAKWKSSLFNIMNLLKKRLSPILWRSSSEYYYAISWSPRNTVQIQVACLYLWSQSFNRGRKPSFHLTTQDWVIQHCKSSIYQ